VSEPYRFIKNLQQAIRKPNGRKSTVKDMLVLSQQNDPFYAGNGVEGEKARWFAELWERFGYGSGVHLRRVHYRIVSEGRHPTTIDIQAVAELEVLYLDLMLTRRHSSTDALMLADGRE
jgi:hypothetical protein